MQVLGRMVRTVTVSILIVFGVNCMTFLEYYKWLVYIFTASSSNMAIASKKLRTETTTIWMTRTIPMFGPVMTETRLHILTSPMGNGCVPAMASLGASC